MEFSSCAWHGHRCQVCNDAVGFAGGIVDTWDRTREAVEVTWDRLPTPLPGLSSARAVQDLLAWGMGLSGSPRVDDADAGRQCMRASLLRHTDQKKAMLEICLLIQSCSNLPSQRARLLALPIQIGNVEDKAHCGHGTHERLFFLLEVLG